MPHLRRKKGRWDLPGIGRGFVAGYILNMTPGGAALIGLMHRYLAGLMDTSISLLEVHKLLYFLQIAKKPLRLQFSKGQYGPYAENLRHVLLAIEGHLVSGYSDNGDVPDKQLELVPGAIQDADNFLMEHVATNWNPAKRKFSPSQISLAAERMREQGWMA